MRLRRVSSALAILLAIAPAVSGVSGVRAAFGADWPTYRHDNARSGITSETIKAPLSECWVFEPRHAPAPAWEPPRSVPVEGILELPRARFDDAYHVAVAGGGLYFASSSDNKVYCLDAATGKLRWSKITGGPVRLAPAFWKDRIYLGSDDGFAYCLDAGDGKVEWRFHAAPHDDRVLGHGRMISLWPLRTGVLVDDGVAYFGAGIFPAEGIYLYAVRAKDGTIVWKNDTCGETTSTNISLQGYLLASSTRLFAPMARVSPAAFERATGRFLGATYFGKTIGGTYALLAEDYVFTGTEEMIAYRQDNRQLFAWFPGRQLIVTGDMSYMANDREMSALDRKSYPKASLRRQQAILRMNRLNGPLHLARKRRHALERSIKRLESGLKLLEEAKGDKTSLQAQRETFLKNLSADKKALEAAQREVAHLEAQRKVLADEVKAAEEAMGECIKWRLPCECPDSMILASTPPQKGALIFAGGKDHVIAVDPVTGKKVWTGKVEGKAKGLAAAGGRLFVSTDTGAIYCFGPPELKTVGAVTEATETSPYPEDNLTPMFEAAAEEIVRETGIKKGYCLVLGCGTGRLAFELAKRTDLMIYGVEADARKVEEARKALDAAGLYGVRVCIDQWSRPTMPYSDYFANLIVSESALASGKLPCSAAEAYRMLKPWGGVMYINQPVEALGRSLPLTAESLRKWWDKAGVKGGIVTERDGVRLKLVRGPLEGAGRWTHEYADTANTTSSSDVLVKFPLGTLWFGNPGPLKMLSRHRRCAGPVALNGRLFVQGENVVMAYDSSNGLKLWEMEIPGAVRTGVSLEASNFAANDDSVFTAAKDQCFRLDPATGRTLRIYTLPPSKDEKPRRWGYLACTDKLLYGSRTAGSRYGDCVFATDIKSGKRKWVFTGKGIIHTSISIGDGCMFLIDGTVSDEERQEALKSRIAEAKKLEGLEKIDAENAIKTACVRRVVALDAKTGQKIWEKVMDLTGCGGGAYFQTIGTIYKDGVLVVFGVYTDGHFWREFFAGQFESRRITVLDAKDGNVMWSKCIGYRVRPLVIGDTLHAEPWKFDLRTGEQKMRVHPVTGRKEPWQFARPGHHCGCPAGSPNGLFFRSYFIGYYDLAGDYGTMHFGAQRTGCWINFIAANGLLLIPEASSGCMCPFPNMCTVVFKHRKANRAWAVFSSPGDMTPVKHFAINLGAPGERKDSQGRLWFGYPRPGGWLVLQFKLETRFVPGGTFFKRNSDTIQVSGTDCPWVFASGGLGLSRCIIPLLGEADGKASYTVRLAFADLDNDQPGKRVFDIKLQGKVVCKDFDIVKEAGGGNAAVFKEFKGIESEDKLTIELVPKVAKPDKLQMPLLQGIVIEREKVLGVGMAVPSFLLSDSSPEQSGEVRMANNTEKDFTGTLEVVAPEGFAVTPNKTKIALAPGDRTQVAVKATLTKKMPRGKYEVHFKLVRRDGGIEADRPTEIEHLADRDRMVFKVVEDAHVGRPIANTNQGASTILNVDGGNRTLGDESHYIAYLKFRLDVPGKPLSAVLRLYNSGNPTGNSGQLCLVAEPWSESKITYKNRPKPGKVLAKIGPVTSMQVVELPLDLSLEGMTELSLAIDPTGCDGVNYLSREGGKPAELVVEYKKQAPSKRQ